MKEIIFARDWNKNPEKTWSGTAWHLKEALLRYYRIKDCNLKLHCLRDYLAKVKLVKRDCGLKTIQTNRKRNKKIPLKKHPVFQFDETFLCSPSYLYIDLCVDFLCYFSKANPELFKYSGFQKILPEMLQKRSDEQTDYIKNNCTCVFTMGKWLQKYMIEKMNLPESKVKAVGGGINIDSSKIDYSKKTGNKILFVGRDFERKGGYLVLEAFRKLRVLKPESELYIVGPSKNPAHGDIENIHFVGDIDSNKLHEYFNLCDVFCMPSFFEAYGLVFIEALTFGLPCIGRNVFEMSYFIEDEKTGYLLQYGDSDELACLMKKCLENEIMKKTVREKKQEYLDEYSWDSVAKRCAREIN